MRSKINDFEFTSFIPYRITRLNARLNRQAATLLERYGDVTLTQWRIILLLKHEGVDTLSEISDISGIDKGLLSRNLTGLIDDGLVEMARDEADRRVNRLHLTASGEALHERIQPIMTWRQQRLMRDLTPEQAEAIIAVFDVLDRAAEDLSFSP